ncbi:hypothetical protein [Metabacillus arenae]|uniref:Zinc-finger domain-containing protein n=1 Tax=Metabacillus arenae TaxID=2771434 RepID=A0A926RXJ4_9BACI|nr:hypothetical protein [Metabacillus arenae]MBD1380750.1 hypothetical protein [Metabacillus arenae]
MTKFDDLHILCQELIPIYSEIDEEAKQVIERHAEECEFCKKKLNTAANIEITPKEMNDDNTPVKRFKKLFLLKKVNTLLVLTLRVIVLGLITFDFFQRFSQNIPHGIQFEGLRASLVLFYIPLSFVLLMFTWFIKNKRTFWITLILDVLILYFFDNIIRLFV